LDLPFPLLQLLKRDHLVHAADALRAGQERRRDIHHCEQAAVVESGDKDLPPHVGMHRMVNEVPEDMAGLGNTGDRSRCAESCGGYEYLLDHFCRSADMWILAKASDPAGAIASLSLLAKP